MANTYVNIASSTVSSATASVTFSSIPNTYNNLVLLGSIRDTEGSAVSRSLQIRANNDATTIYSFTRAYGTGSSAVSDYNTSRTQFVIETYGSNGSTSTANTFTNFELYIPNYTSSANKQVYFASVVENNATEGYINSTAQLYRNTSAISQLQIRSHSGNSSIASGSTFYLYGIKNS